MLLRLTTLALTLLLLSTNINPATIGKVTEQKGNNEIVRKKDRLDAKVNQGVESMDSVQTANGVVGITFEDDTKVRVTEHSKLVIDDFVYDPKNKGAGKLAMKVALGTVRYASGNIAKDNNKNVDIKTPTATVAVRGTAFTMTVDEVGGSTVILLPNPDGTVGEIEVRTANSAVTLNRAFQATFVRTAESKPTKPILLALSESAIDNMLIVKPPKELVRQLVEEASTAADALKFNELDRNLLDLPIFTNPFTFDELNVNLLDSNYLTNALDMYFMNAFIVGYNPVSQVYVFDKNSAYQIERHLKHDLVLLINKEKGYDMTLIQEGTIINFKNQDATTNTIFIKQVGK